MLSRLLKLTGFATLGFAVLGACAPLPGARIYNDPYVRPAATTVVSPRVYRASDGQVFTSRAERNAYQQRLTELDLLQRERTLTVRERQRELDRRRELERQRDLNRERQRDLNRERERVELERRERLDRDRERQRLERARELERQRELQRLEDSRRQRTTNDIEEQRRLARLRKERERIARQLRLQELEGRRASQTPQSSNLPDGWTTGYHDGKLVWIDTEGRIRSPGGQ